MKRITQIFALSITLFCFFGCASNNKTVSTNEKDNPIEEKITETIETVDFAPDAEHVKFLGRSVYENDALIMSYSSTGAAFNISAKYLDFTVIGDGSEARLVVFVNDERVFDKMLNKYSETFNVFNKNEIVEGEVKILKVSESTSSSVAISKITTDVDGKISPAADKNLKIEFIGDSITCGYGVDDLNRNNHFKVSTEDNTKSYAYKTAQLLDADYSMVSASGFGVISGYTGDGKKQTWGVLSQYYGKLGANSKNVNGYPPSKVDWDFSEFIPDVVVLNLGTNDASYTKGDKDKISEFVDAYIDFLKTIRTKNENAYIICSLGTMSQDLFPAIQTAVSEYTAETNDDRISTLKFPAQNMSDGIAADWHPSEKTHTKAADILAVKIKEIIK